MGELAGSLLWALCSHTSLKPYRGNECSERSRSSGRSHSGAARTREQVKKLKGHWTPKAHSPKHLMHCPTESQESSPAMLPPSGGVGSSRAHKGLWFFFLEKLGTPEPGPRAGPALTVAAFFPSSPAPPPPPGSTCLSPSVDVRREAPGEEAWGGVLGRGPPSCNLEVSQMASECPWKLEAEFCRFESPLSYFSGLP